MQWSSAKIIKLIEMYKEKTMLWNPNHEKYRDKPTRRDALNDIASKLDYIPVAEIERKIHGLRTQFLRECRNKIGTSTWFAFDHLKFLLNINGRPRSFNSSFNRDEKIFKVR